MNHVARFKWLVLVICFLLAGCAENPGTWGEEKIKDKIVESLEMDDLTLTAKTGGGYEGSGKRGEEILTIEITQDPDAHRLSWDVVGDRGFMEQGFFELK